MRWLFSHVLNVIFPESADEKRIAACTLAEFRNKYHTHMHAGSIALSSFADPVVRSAIHLNKFHNHTHAQKLLASLLVRYFETLTESSYVLIPIPLSSSRMQARGHNQVVSVLQRTDGSRLHLILKTDILLRTRNTPPQTTLTCRQRSQNMQGAFTIASSHRNSITGSHILLVDDVLTTGATLREAKATLLPHKPASITCLAFSH
jgi:ComF family protein